MKPAELEALVIAQGKKLQEQAEAHMHLVQRADNIVEGFKQELAEVYDQVEKLSAWIGAADADGPFHEEFKTLTATVEALREKVEGRNKSAAVKRNMTDADAVRVLQGDLSTLGHKEAAEELGLTYAQVYSCRLGFTFKHVIRDLEKADWRNRWAKGG